MKPVLLALAKVTLTLVTLTGCSRKPAATVVLEAKAAGEALVLVSGEKQAVPTGSQLDQPLVVQVNDAQGAAVPGALVRFTGEAGTLFSPPQGLTGTDGQLSTTVTLGSVSGHYSLLASTPAKSGKAISISIDEVALGYREVLGARLSELYCVRCHDPESTAERVSNRDNLTAKAHGLTDGVVLNAMSTADLVAIIAHGGAGLSKSAEMPPYGNTLSRPEIAALVAYLRAVSDPPYVAERFGP